MKVRLTVLLEYQKKKADGLTEEMAANYYQMLLNGYSIIDGRSKATVEKAEFVESK